ncbi:hypothetical protein [Micromonospora sp. NPDC048843]|uniref:hypothetical protein n=1 Tax=Micromonospora sp. NPDC048843 TaxID=3155389 RepID=UPI0033F1874D
MLPLPALLDDAAVGIASGGLLYTASITTAALVALLAPTPARRRDARKVLALLLRRSVTENPNPGKPTQQ